jgi:hypothetical protein
MTGLLDAARLLDRRRLRALSLAVRHDVDTSAVRSHATDPSLVARLESPFESVEDAHERIRALEMALRDGSDRRAIFATIYSRMTGAVRAAIESGRFTNAEWMRQYTVTFAEYYRRAFLAFERGRPGRVPDPWVVAFGTALEGSALVAQDAFLGINAHINYDLALALRDVGIDPNRPEKWADHARIDDILAGLIDAQQRALADLYAPGLADVDASLGRFDERLSLFPMTEGRAQAWRLAVVLTDFDGTPVTRYVRWVLRTTATGAAQFVRSPPVDPAVLQALERVEQDMPLCEALTVLADRLDAR